MLQEDEGGVNDTGEPSWPFQKRGGTGNVIVMVNMMIMMILIMMIIIMILFIMTIIDMSKWEQGMIVMPVLTIDNCNHDHHDTYIGMCHDVS